MYEKSIVGGVLAIVKSPLSVAGALRKSSEVSVTTVLPPGSAGGYDTGSSVSACLASPAPCAWSANENSRPTTNDASGHRHRSQRESKKTASVSMPTSQTNNPGFTRGGLPALEEPITRATRGVSSGDGVEKEHTAPV